MSPTDVYCLSDGLRANSQILEGCFPLQKHAISLSIEFFYILN